MRRKEGVDRAFRTQDGKVGDDLTEGGEKFLKEPFVELVEGFGGHGEADRLECASL